ncbi:MAG: HD domain-containing protein [Actinobacteria bacterium]|nr:HD domain-containing protein [Actinomycetota bacterium]MCL5026468.1 HD domain-containing protein [Chloroflexota bacterium]
MADLDALRDGLRRSLPELGQIKDAGLREKVVEAWALALSQSEFTRIEEIRPSGNPDSPPLKHGTQADHLRGVARVALGIADGLEQAVGPIGVDRDLLLACALCHDLGKPFEFSPANQARWRANPAASGYPALRHPVYGAHIALTAGLPEAVAHAAGGHSGEGELVIRSLENTIVHYADRAFWRVLARAGLLEGNYDQPAR